MGAGRVVGQGWTGAAAAALLLLGGSVGCGGARPATRVQASAPLEAQRAAAAQRYVDEELGFELSRPSRDWQLDALDERTPEGLVIPLILRHRASGAQVVLQVAPAVATPTQFAERLTVGLRTQPGFTATDPEPLPLSDSAVGFLFTMGEAVQGKVAVLPGGEDRVFMMMATWPARSPVGVQESVDAIIGSVHPLPRGRPAPASFTPEPPMALR